MTFAHSAEGIVEVCRALYERGLIAAAEGNVSIRLQDGRVLVTPAGADKGAISAADLISVGLSGVISEGGGHAPSTELAVHLAVYRQRPDVRAVVHAHPPSATAFAVCGEDLTEPILPELLLTAGPVPLVPYARSGTRELAEAVEPWLDGHDTLLLENHGALATGANLSETFRRMECLEHGARILLAARALGRPRRLAHTEGTALLASWRASRQLRLTSHHDNRDDS